MSALAYAVVYMGSADGWRVLDAAGFVVCRCELESDARHILRLLLAHADKARVGVTA